jgi:hypothetical protein
LRAGDQIEDFGNVVRSEPGRLVVRRGVQRGVDELDALPVLEDSPPGRRIDHRSGDHGGGRRPEQGVQVGPPELVGRVGQRDERGDVRVEPRGPAVPFGEPRMVPGQGGPGGVVQDRPTLRASASASLTPCNGRSSASGSNRSAGSGTAAATAAASSGPSHASAARAASNAGQPPRVAPGGPRTARGSARRRAPWPAAARRRGGSRGRRPGTAARRPSRVQESQVGGRWALQPVTELRAVRHPAPRPDENPGLLTAGVVDQPSAGRLGEAAATPLADQHRQIDEGQPGTSDDHVRARGQDRQVTVGGELLGQVAEPVLGRAGGDLGAGTERDGRQGGPGPAGRRPRPGGGIAPGAPAGGRAGRR